MKDAWIAIAIVAVGAGIAYAIWSRPAPMAAPTPAPATPTRERRSGLADALNVLNSLGQTAAGLYTSISGSTGSGVGDKLAGAK